MDTKKKGLLIVVSGPSGAGKSTIIEKFLENDINIRFSVSYTTRQKRDHEVNGKDYYFVDNSTFQEMVEKDLLIARKDHLCQTHGFDTYDFKE